MNNIEINKMMDVSKNPRVKVSGCPICGKDVYKGERKKQFDYLRKNVTERSKDFCLLLERIERLEERVKKLEDRTEGLLIIR